MSAAMTQLCHQVINSYESNHYETTVQAEFAQLSPLPPCYVWKESRPLVVTREIGTCLVYIVQAVARVMYEFLHRVIGQLIVASCWESNSTAAKVRGKLLQSNEKPFLSYIYKRSSIMVDGRPVDIIMMGTKKTWQKRRWTIMTGGNAELGEDCALRFRPLLSHLKSNGIFFNLPGVGSSPGSISRDAAERAYRGVLAFLEDGKEGVGADEIVLYGYSLGAAVQADALRSLEPKPHIRYVAVKDRTFSRLDSLISSIIFIGLGEVARWFGWDMDVATASKNLRIPEVILQTTTSRVAEDYHQVSGREVQCYDDGMIPAHLALAHELRDDPSKTILSLCGNHCSSTYAPEILAKKINAILMEIR